MEDKAPAGIVEPAATSEVKLLADDIYKDNKKVSDLSIQQLNDLSADMIANKSAYQSKYDDAQHLYNIVNDRIEDLSAASTPAPPSAAPKAEAGNAEAAGTKEPWQVIRERLVKLRDDLSRKADERHKQDPSFTSAEDSPSVERIKDIIESGDIVDRKADILKGRAQAKMEEIHHDRMVEVLKDYPELQPASKFEAEKVETAGASPDATAQQGVKSLGARPVAKASVIPAGEVQNIDDNAIASFVNEEPTEDKGGFKSKAVYKLSNEHDKNKVISATQKFINLFKKYSRDNPINGKFGHKIFFAPNAKAIERLGSIDKAWIEYALHSTTLAKQGDYQARYYDKSKTENIDNIESIIRDADGHYKSNGKLYYTKKLHDTKRPNTEIVLELSSDGNFEDYRYVTQLPNKKEFRAPLVKPAAKGLGQEQSGGTPSPDRNDNIPPTTDNVNIQDTGEKLGGARKDRAAFFKKEYTDDDIASLPLSKIWPKNEADAIEDPFMAAFAHAARAAIPTKPQLKYKVSRWVERVKMFRQMMSDLFADIEAGTYDRKKMLEKSKSFPTLKEFFVKVRLLEAINRNQWDRIGEVDEHPDAYRYGDKTGENGKSEHIAAPYVSVYIDGRYKSFEGAKTIEEAIDKIKEALDKTPPTQAESIKSFEVRGSKDHYFINKKGDSQYHKLKEFTSAEEALNYRNEHTDELWKAWDAVKELENVAKEDVRHKDNRPRTGKDHRGGKDVTAQQFIDAFGFRGVEFGNWVAQGKNAKERQGMLNEAYDAIMDLADILGVPPKAISLNGTLGLGFGSRGQGWAAAHYEPDTIVINLTKTKGSGTFSHEFFHALDHYFQRKRSVEEKGREKTYITYSPETYYQDQYGTRLTEARYNEILKRHNLNPGAWTKVEGVRPEVAEAFKALVDALDASPMSERVSHIKNKYWSRIIERAARSFENYVIVKMAKQGYQNDYLANVVRLEDFKREAGRYPYLMDEEIAPIETAFDHLFETIQTRETDKGIELFSKGRSVRVETPISVEDANGIISRFLNAGKFGAIVRLNLADSFDALPDEIRQAAEDAGGTKDNTYGILHKDGSIWLIRDAHATPEQLEKSIFHEVFGHLGIFKLFGKDVIRELHVLSSKLGGYRRMAQIADKYGVRKDFDSYYNDAQQEDSEIRKNARATAELLALIGQKSPSLMQQAKSVWGAIRQALRKMGLISISKYNDTDLAYLLAEGKKALYKPGTAGGWTVLMTAWQGGPYDFNQEVLVESPDGTREYLVGTPDVMPQIPAGYKVIKEFPKGRHRSDKIGTGEGAQAYGYGHYFGSKRKVGEFYRDALSAKRNLGVPTSRLIGSKLSRQEIRIIDEAKDEFDLWIKIAKVPYPRESFRDYIEFYNFKWKISDLDTEYYEANKEQIDGQIHKWESEVRAKHPEWSDEKVKEALDYFGADSIRHPYKDAYDAAFKIVKKHAAGRLYQVELAPAEDEYLLWDKPLSEQSEKVRSILNKAGLYNDIEAAGNYFRIEPTASGKSFKVVSGAYEYGTYRTKEAADAKIADLQKAYRSTGQSFYYDMKNSRSSDKAASAYLCQLSPLSSQRFSP